MTELEALLILNALPGLGNKRVFALVTHFGNARAVLQQPAEDWGVVPSAMEAVRQFDRDRFLSEEMRRIADADVHVLTLFDPLYPSALKEIPDAPMVLYLQGAIPDWDQTVSIVGSRRASLYGLHIARTFARDLAVRDVTVVSGFARGIDTAAHKGTLDADGRTVAVLGSGLANIYPAENERLVEKVLKHGLLISEFPMATPPYPYHFPRRNRIVSGLSKGVVVVEAALKSGALITADFALEQGRDVYCVPGPVDSPASAGVHYLIQQGAKLITCVEDILEERMPFSDKTDTTSVDHDRLTAEENQLLNKLGKGPKHIDELGKDAAAVLLKLEMKKLVKQLPGKHYIK